MAIVEGSLRSGGHGRPTENCPCGAESEYFEGQIEGYSGIFSPVPTQGFFTALSWAGRGGGCGMIVYKAASQETPAVRRSEIERSQEKHIE
jgi:hypothetical protein